MARPGVVLDSTALDARFLKLDGTNAPTADFVWTTNLTTSGTLQGANVVATSWFSCGGDAEIEGTLTLSNPLQVDEIEITGPGGIHLPDLSPLYFGAGNDIKYSFNGATNVLTISQNLGSPTITNEVPTTFTEDLVSDKDVFAQSNRFLPQVLQNDVTQTMVTGSGWRTMKSLTIPGGTLGTDNAIRVMAYVRRTTGTGTAKFKFTYGGSDVVVEAGVSKNDGIITMLLHGKGATNSQKASVTGRNAGDQATAYGTSAIDSTVDQTLALLVDLTIDTDVWAVENFLVEVIK